MLKRWRLQEREVRGELRLLLGWHARHTRVASHATVRRWLLLLRSLDEIAALLHLLLHEHGVFVHARWRTCRCALSGPAAWILVRHLLRVVSRHLRWGVAQQMVVDQTRRWGSTWSRCMRLGRLANPKVEVLLWTGLLRCWTGSLALQETEQEFTVTVRGLGSLGALSCEKVLDADVRSSCAAGGGSTRGRSTGSRVVRAVLRRIRIMVAVGGLGGFGRHHVAWRER